MGARRPYLQDLVDPDFVEEVGLFLGHGGEGEGFFKELPLASGFEAVLDIFEPHVRVDDGSEGVGYVASGSRDADKLFEALGRGVTHCHSANGYDSVELVGMEGEVVAQLGAVKALVGILEEGLLHHLLGHVEAEEVPKSASEKAFTHQAGPCADI